MKEGISLLSLLRHWRRKKTVALATILKTHGSTPQVAGATALFSKEALLEGTVGGGLIEAGVHKIAARALIRQQSRLVDFELKGRISSFEEAVCGGSVTVLIDASLDKHIPVLRSMRRSLSQRKEGVLCALIETSKTGRANITRAWIETTEFGTFPGKMIGQTHLSEKDIRLAMERKAPLFLKRRGRAGRAAYLFLEPFAPLPRLLIAGAGHVGQAVARLAARLDFEVTVVDDRPEYANRRRFPEADNILVGDIGQAVRDFGTGPDTSIVIVTRGHSHDAEALRACIRSKATYIGMIGSSRKVDLMKKMFLKKRWSTAAEFDLVRTPIGLDIHSKTVEEIAVSIAAELVLVRSRGRERNQENR